MNFINSQKGQTLIETMVAAFILVMGISAALGLANYSLGATGSIRQRTIAIGLSREGLEVVKNMRDTNWLRGTQSSDCHDFLSGNATAYCYRGWLDAVYNIAPIGPSGTYTIDYTAGDETPWSLTRGTSYGLDLDTNPDTHGTYYYPGGGNSKFFRKITITQEVFEPFNEDTGPRLKVSSQVWWVDKNCPLTTDVVADSPCLVTLETYLTNWRNF